MHQKSLSEKFLNLKIGIPVAIIFLSLLGALLLYSHFLLRVKNIYVVGFPKEMTLYGLDEVKNKILYLVDEGKLSESLVRSNPIIYKVTTYKQYPETIRLTIETDGPLAVFEVKQGFFLLSSRGRILHKQKTKTELVSYPLIRYYQSPDYYAYQSGDTLDHSDITKTLEILKGIKDMGLQVITIDIDGIDMIGLNLEGKQILFSVDKDIQSQLYQLEQIIRQFRIQGGDYRKIDLRFNKPVLELSTQ